MTMIPVTHYPQYCSQKALSPLFWHQCLKVATVKKKNTWHLVTAEVVLGRRDVGCDRFRLLKGQSGHVGAMKTAINAPVSMNAALLEKHSQPRNSTPRQTVNLHHIWQQWHQCNAGRKRDTLVCCLSQNSFWQHEAKYCKLKCFLLTNEFSGFYLSPPRCHFFFFFFLEGQFVENLLKIHATFQRTRTLSLMVFGIQMPWESAVSQRLEVTSQCMLGEPEGLSVTQA